MVPPPRRRQPNNDSSPIKNKQDESNLVIPPATPKEMKVVELREALLSRGLSPKGLKRELMERLEAALVGKAEPTSLRQVEGANSSSESNSETEMVQPKGLATRSSLRKRPGSTVSCDEEEMTKISKFYEENIKQPASPERVELGDDGAEEKEGFETKVIKKPTLTPMKHDKVNNDESPPLTKPYIIILPNSRPESGPSETLMVNDNVEIVKEEEQASNETIVEEQQCQQQQQIELVPEKNITTTTITTPSYYYPPLLHSESLASSSSLVVQVKNFVRPLTTLAVRELVGQFGNFSEFWMDSKKTLCFIKYEQGNSAQECVSKLTGLKWPLETGRLLEASLSSEENLKVARQEELKQQSSANSSPFISKEEPVILDKLFMKTETTPHLYYLPVHSLLE